ncbi:MAG TPA: cytochrome c family protein [Sphingomonas sp.]
MAAAPASAQAGDAVKGKATFAKCMICHAVEPGKNKLGPTLSGVVGRKAGTVPGYAYSAAMKAIGLTWTPAVLDKYLASPRAVVPGTKMIFAGLPAPADRANVIAYLGNPAAVK